MSNLFEDFGQCATSICMVQSLMYKVVYWRITATLWWRSEPAFHLAQVVETLNSHTGIF